MSEIRRRLLERITHPSYLSGLTERPIDELRDMREDCRSGEAEISFERRVCQARIDILEAELDRRAGRGGPDIVARLPQILSRDAMPTDLSLPSRAPNFAMPRSVDVPRRRVDEIVGERVLARLSDIPPEEARAILATLAGYEAELSTRRHQVHEVMDRIQAEIVRRYVSGEVDPTAALG